MVVSSSCSVKTTIPLHDQSSLRSVSTRRNNDTEDAEDEESVPLAELRRQVADKDEEISMIEEDLASERRK